MSVSQAAVFVARPVAYVIWRSIKVFTGRETPVQDVRNKESIRCVPRRTRLLRENEGKTASAIFKTFRRGGTPLALPTGGDKVSWPGSVRVPSVA